MSSADDKLVQVGLFYVISIILFIGSFFLLNIFYKELADELYYWYILFFGLISILFGLRVFRALFGSLKIMLSNGRTVHLSPLLEMTSVKEDDSKVATVAPETGTCTFCGREVYKPFICTDCKQLFCGQHILPGDHDCQR